MGQGDGCRPGSDFVSSWTDEKGELLAPCVRQTHNLTDPSGQRGGGDVLLIAGVVRNEELALATPERTGELAVAHQCSDRTESPVWVIWTQNSSEGRNPNAGRGVARSLVLCQELW